MVWLCPVSWKEDELVCLVWMGEYRNWNACYFVSQWSPSGSWRWIRRMDWPKNHVKPNIFLEWLYEWSVWCMSSYTIFCGSNDFTAFADVCFREFGSKVKSWWTINEPNMLAWGGYDLGVTPPMHCSPPFGIGNCSRGNSSTEPYIALHNMLLAHASTARLYKQTYKV